MPLLCSSMLRWRITDSAWSRKTKCGSVRLKFVRDLVMLMVRSGHCWILPNSSWKPCRLIVWVNLWAPFTGWLPSTISISSWNAISSCIPNTIHASGSTIPLTLRWKITWNSKLFPTRKPERMIWLWVTSNTRLRPNAITTALRLSTALRLNVRRITRKLQNSRMYFTSVLSVQLFLSFRSSSLLPPADGGSGWMSFWPTKTTWFSNRNPLWRKRTDPSEIRSTMREGCSWQFYQLPSRWINSCPRVFSFSVPRIL